MRLSCHNWWYFTWFCHISLTTMIVFEIIRLGLLSKIMNLHVLYPSNFHNLWEEVVEVLCLMEWKFLPIIFNISMHLEYQVEWCGIVRTRRMYPVTDTNKLFVIGKN